MSGSYAYREYLTAEIVDAQAIAQRLGLGASDFFCLNVISIAGTATAGVTRTACAGRTVTACFGPTVVRPSRTGAVLVGPVPMIQSSWPR
jgi:hypothetical protein